MGLHDVGALLPYSEVEGFQRDQAGNVIGILYRYKSLVFSVGNGSPLAMEVVR